MTNAKLIERARRYKALRAEAAQLTNEATEVGQGIVKELDRRKENVVDHDGLRITKTERFKVELDPAALKARVKPSVFKRVVTSVVERQAVAVEVKAGNMEQADVDACTTRTPSAAYPVITDREAA